MRQAEKTVPLPASGEGSTESSVPCPRGKRVVSGGAAVTVTPPPPSAPTGAVAFLSRSEPADESTWTATAQWFHQNATAGQTLTLVVKAICGVVT